MLFIGPKRGLCVPEEKKEGSGSMYQVISTMNFLGHPEFQE